MSSRHSKEIEKLLRRLPADARLSSAIPRNILDRRTASSPHIERLGEAVLSGQPLDPEEDRILFSLLSPGLRPLIEIFDDLPVAVDHPLWLDLNEAATRTSLSRVARATGRIEFSGGAEYRNAGSGFLVGENLVMTNRHVAEIFCVEFPGFGSFLRPQFSAQINFCREARRWDADPTRTVKVTAVEMMHPWFDLALLRIEDMPAEAEPLKLATKTDGTVIEHKCCVIGYPSFNPDEDTEIQREAITEFDAKHLSPGFVDSVQTTTLRGRRIRALGHDSSTLGGNSGAPVADIDTGTVLGLHFHGNAEGLNWAIPAGDIASDIRIVQSGVTFDGVPNPSEGPWTAAWQIRL